MGISLPNHPNLQAVNMNGWYRRRMMIWNKMFNMRISRTSVVKIDVEGDKTPPPGDVSSDSVSSDSESEDEEVDVAPEATVGTITQKPYAIRDFPRGLFKAELGTCQTEIALLKSKNKNGEKEKELLNHDLENVERALGNVLERMSVLESGENATLKKRLAETETKLAWARMERDIAERRLHESRVWNKMFYLDMVRIGAVPKPPSDDEDTERPRNKLKKSTSDGTEGSLTATCGDSINLLRG
ncbi:hypothetical protein Tco_0058596 [Tanacetum coccineum]